MTSRSRLEGDIAERLMRLSDVDMQRLAEDYVQIRFPDRFARFNFRAFSESGKSRPGWPDAWVADGGPFHGVEVTSAKDKAAILRHLKDDLNKARVRVPNWASFVFFSGHPAVQLSPQEMDDLHRRFGEETGLEPQAIDLIFGGGLIQELARPEFARTRIEVLGVSDRPRHFHLVDARRGPDEDRLRSDFIPSEEDYRQSRVHRPAAGATVQARLEEERCALIRGVGASGKSVLGWLLALDVSGQRRPAYWLDLSEYTEANPESRSGLVEDLQRFGHPLALFILDNCHLEERITKELFLAWQDMSSSQQPRLLLLARELRSSRGSLIDGLPLEALTLKARQAEVHGVYQRLAWQALCRGGSVAEAEPPQPPKPFLDAWVRTFGGDPRSEATTTDLIAFSAAVQRRMPYLLREDWTLREEDAIEEVRSIYLDPGRLGDGELANLLRLCLLEELELGLAEEALVDRRTGFRVCGQRLGLVFQQRIGPNQYIRYRLAHAALSRLILKAATESPERLGEMQEAARLSPHFGGLILARLIAGGELEEAGHLLDVYWRRPASLLKLGPITYLGRFLALQQRLGVPIPRELVDNLSSPPLLNQLKEQALESSLDGLAGFLEQLCHNQGLQRPLSSLITELEKVECRSRLLNRALDTPFEQLSLCLQTLKSNPGLRTLFDLLTADLNTEANADILWAKCLTRLQSLANCLRLSSRLRELSLLRERVVSALNDPTNTPRITELALAASLQDLAGFLDLLAQNQQLDPLRNNLSHVLNEPESRHWLIEDALQSSLNSLAICLNLLSRHPELQAIHANLAADLQLPESLQILIEKVHTCPINCLPRLLKCCRSQDELNVFYRALIAALRDRRHVDGLIERVLTSSLGDIDVFLAYTFSLPELQDVTSTWVQLLAEPRHHDTFINLALNAPFQSLTGFLNWSAITPRLKPIFDVLKQGISQPENFRQFTQSATTASLSELVNFFSLESLEGLRDRVVPAIDLEEWNRTRLCMRSPHLASFVRFQKGVLKMGRAELAESPALRLVQTSSFEDWDQDQIGLHHFSHVLRLARGASAVDREDFLRRIALPQWVDQRLRASPPRGLAGNLLALATFLPPSQHHFFQREALERRLQRELPNRRLDDPERWAVSLSLLGAARALGISLGSTATAWPQGSQLREALQLRAPDPVRTSIGPREIQIWLGLREMARCTNERARLDAALGERVLGLWRAVEAGPDAPDLLPHVRELNGKMIRWLELCRSVGWRLQPPQEDGRLTRRPA